MRRLCLLAVALLLTASGLLSAQTLQVTRSSNLRGDPSTAHQPKAHVDRGDTVERLEPQNIGGYALVRFGEIEGWIWLRNVKVIAESSPAEPVALAPLTAAAPPSALRKACPIDGKAGGSARQKATDRLKNRTGDAKPSDVVSTITLEAMLKRGNDETRFSESDAAEIVGYVEKVKAGDKETVNCSSPYPEDYDTHIELSGHPGDPSTKRVIVEITPRVRAIGAQQGEDWTTNALKADIEHRWVRVRGWMLWDYHHKGNATNTKPGGDHLWRATVWEIHPITGLVVCSGGANTC